MPQKDSNLVSLSSLRRETPEQALERLFNEHSGALRGFLRVRLGVREEMEDIVQEVFAKVAKLESLPQRLPPGEASNRSYLFAVANHLVVDMERSRLLQRRYEDVQRQQTYDEIDHTEASPEAITLVREELERVKKVIAGLRPVWREAFILNRFRHMSYRQIAEEMNISVKTVEKYIKKALIRVRNEAIINASGDKSGGQRP